jgi:hypothetical protein
MTTTVLRTGSIKHKIVSPDLQRERDNCAFDQEELRNFVYGGKEIKDKF